MKYLGIDYGTKRVGVAVSDAAGTIAFPRATLPNDDKLLSHLEKLVKNEKIGSIVVGDTRSHGGKDNPVTAEAEAFVAALEGAIAVPIERVWEMWSSIEASRYAPEGKGHDDAAAAAVILQRFLDMHGKK
ncbi:Holliday junction resolvase RuvX [Candidatus Kaiserbacteria bacterium]|nr:Holliday junction resolvase RuvX [Candidatus Kaiserbacteria bacterium]